MSGKAGMKVLPANRNKLFELFKEQLFKNILFSNESQEHI